MTTLSLNGIKFRSASRRRYIAVFVGGDGKVHTDKRSDNLGTLRTYARRHRDLVIIDTVTGAQVPDPISR